METLLQMFSPHLAGIRRTRYYLLFIWAVITGIPNEPTWSPLKFRELILSPKNHDIKISGILSSEIMMKA